MSVPLVKRIREGSIKVPPVFLEPTIRDSGRFNAEEDAKALQKAMKGFGSDIAVREQRSLKPVRKVGQNLSSNEGEGKEPFQRKVRLIGITEGKAFFTEAEDQISHVSYSSTDEKAIINLVTKRTNQQRQVIAEAYQTLYNKDLLKDLKSELSGTLSDVVIGLMQSPDVFDAHEMNKAISGLGTDEEALVEILCSRTNAELYAMKQTYQRMFKKDLEKEISGDTSGYFRRLLLSEVQIPRNETDEIFLYQSYHEALALWETGPKKWAQDEAFSIPIFTRRSHAHLRHVFDEYKAICGLDIEKDVSNEITGDVADFFLAIIKLTRNAPGYFAERLYKAMKGLGTHERTVIRVLVSRSEKDLGNVKSEFQRIYGKSLESWISGDFSGDSKRILLTLIGEAPSK